ncbi:MAG: hypothetical protein ACREJT_00200 [Myxococcota bacterium]
MIAFAAIALYFAVFLNYPITRDVPWASLLMLAIALGASAVGFARSRRKLLAGAGLALTLFLGSSFVWYCYVLSYELPSAELALDVGAPVPAVVLRDDRGQDVELAALSRGKLVLVFFRGHW